MLYYVFTDAFETEIVIFPHLPDNAAESLIAVLRKRGLCLVSLCGRIPPREWRIIVYNFCHIIKCVLHAMVYLHGMNIQHCDIKGY